MIIKIIKNYIILLVVFFSWVNIVNAEVFINEVQLSPIEERFIELYNSGNSSINLTGWAIKRKTASGLDYSLVSMSRLKDKLISSNSYFLLTNEYDYTGSITPDATWAKSNSFSNDNTIILYNSNGDLISKAGWGKASDCDGICPSNPTTDQSLQRISSTSWTTASPTPGATNSGVSNTDSSDNSSEDNTVDETVDSISVVNNTSEIFKITTKIISPKIVTAGIPFLLSSLTTTNRGETYAVGKFVWNFGDGMIREVGQSNPFEYIYEYPGEYALTLSYYDSIFSIKPDAIDKITIKVIPSGINISSVGTVGDPFVEIENKSNYEIILSNWVVTAGIHYFIVPEGTLFYRIKK